MLYFLQFLIRKPFLLNGNKPGLMIRSAVIQVVSRGCFKIVIFSFSTDGLLRCFVGYMS